MVARAELLAYLETLLQPELFQDGAPNGLQVEGASEIKSIVTGVSACQALLDKAARCRADAVLVHHGYFWKSEDPCVTGIKRRRLATLLRYNINLMAYHLPLDAHPIYGNNAKIAEWLKADVQNSEKFLWWGKLEHPMKGVMLGAYIEKVLGKTPFYVPGKARTVKTIAWCSGAAQDYIEQAYVLGVDAFLTGEVSERTVHIARETGMHFFAAGHHATERKGIQSLGEHLAEKFNLSHQFIDIDNPV